MLKYETLQKCFAARQKGRSLNLESELELFEVWELMPWR